jgi:hypothetical protein
MAERIKVAGSRRSFWGNGKAAGTGGTRAAVERAHPAHWTAAAGGLQRGSVPSPPDPAQIDSWLRANPDDTVTLFQRWSELPH